VTERAKGRKQEVEGVRVGSEVDGDLEETERRLKKVMMNGDMQGKANGDRY
jgi:hypothetical protein